MGKSVIVAYIWWALGGLFGLHHFYLGRDRHAFFTWALFGGYGGFGLIVDFFRMPSYVDYVNFGKEYQAILKVKGQQLKPRISLLRISAEIVCGNLLSWLVFSAIPEENDGVVGGFNWTWFSVLIPFASAVGVHLVGNIGSQEGPIWPAVLGAYFTFPSYTEVNPLYQWSTWVAAAGFQLFVRRRKYRQPLKEKRNVCKRVTILATCGTIYLALWVSFFYFNLKSTDDYGQSIRFRDSMKNFLKSPLGEEFCDILRRIWRFYQVNGWRPFWDELVKVLFPMDEQDALDVLQLPPYAKPEQIKKRWLLLSDKWDPEKYKRSTLKKEVQDFSNQLQEAYEVLSEVHPELKLQKTPPIDKNRDAKLKMKLKHEEI